MATGRLSAVDIAQLTEQVIYKTDGTDPGNTATVSVNVCNRSSTDNTIFSLAVSDDDTLGDGSHILEHGLVLEPNGVFERTAIFVGAGQSIVLRTDTGNISAVVMGAEVQQVSTGLPTGTTYVIPQTYTVTADAASINEGNSVNFIVNTTGIANGSVLNYTLSGVVSADINGASLSGTMTVNNNVAVLTVATTADSSTEGDETLTFTLTESGDTVDVTILDTSLDPVTPPPPESAIPDPALWYKNSGLDGVSNGSNSYSWANEGTYGSGYNLTSGGNGSRPTKYTQNHGGSNYNYVDFTGNRTLRFSNGTNMRLWGSNSSASHTWFIVYYDAYNQNTFGWMGNVTGGNAGSVGEWSGDDTFWLIFNNDGRPYNFSLRSNSDTFNQQGVRFSSPGSTNGYVYRWSGLSNSIQQVTSNWGTYGADLDVYGIGYTRYSYNQGYLYEFLYYDRSLTDSEVNDVRQYLADTFPNTNVAS